MSDLAAMVYLMSDDPTRADPRPVRERLEEVIDALDAIGATYALCDAVAMGAHGARRFTEDIDVLIDADDLEPLLARLSDYEDVGREPVRLVSVEALVVLKLQAFAANRDAPISGQHRADVARILETCEVDVESIREFLAGHPLLPELEAILAAPPPRGRR